MPMIVTPAGVINDTPITVREREILCLWAKGLKQKEIAIQLLVSPETVKKHLRNVYKKLNAHNKVQALKNAGFL